MKTACCLLVSSLVSTSDKIVAFAAIFISCLALVVSIVQTKVMQKQSHAAVWPRLTNGQSYGDDFFNFEVENAGVGPAIVKSINGDTSISNFYEYMKHLIQLENDSTGETINAKISFSTIQENDVIAVGETVEVFSAQNETAVHLGKKYLLDTDISLEYCSIYDHCWSLCIAFYHT